MDQPRGMPPEMQVRLRLLGFDAHLVKRWAKPKEFNTATIDAWWGWVEERENHPEMLKASLDHYRRRAGE